MESSMKKDVPWQIFRTINVPSCFRSVHFIFLKLLGNLWLKYNLELLSIKAVFFLNILALDLHPKPFAEIQICLFWAGTMFIKLETQRLSIIKCFFFLNLVLKKTAYCSFMFLNDVFFPKHFILSKLVPF